MTEPATDRSLSIVVPAFNEASALGAHLDAIVSYATQRPGEVEILVIDDGSTDRTAAVAAEKRARHPEIRLFSLGRNRGKGYAVRYGLLAAGGAIRGFTDADAATPIAELDRLLPALETGSQLAIGSRAKRQEGVVVSARLHRRLLGRAFNSLLRLLLGLRDIDGRVIQDTQCGFKWLTAEACEAILPSASIDGFGFDAEILYLANRLDLPISEIPVNWADRGTSTVRLTSDPFHMLGAALAVRRRHRNVTP